MNRPHDRMGDFKRNIITVTIFTQFHLSLKWENKFSIVQYSTSGCGLLYLYCDTYVAIIYSLHVTHVSFLGHERNFDKYQLGYIDHLGMPYDYGSVMHYPATAFAIDRRRMTIEPLQSGVTIGQRVRLSEIDAKEIQILYGCIPRPQTGSVTTSQPGVTNTPHVIHVTTPSELNKILFT